MCETSEPIGLDWLCLLYYLGQNALTLAAGKSQGTYFYHSVYFIDFERDVCLKFSRAPWKKTTRSKFIGLSNHNRFKLLFTNRVVLIKSCVEQYYVKAKTETS